MYWLTWEHALPVSLSMPLREDRYIGDPVVAVFDNLLPDTDHIRRRVAEKKGAQGTDAFSLLSVIGRDCVGALQFLPDGEDPDPIGSLDSEPLSDDDVSELIAGLEQSPLGMDREDDFRISVAGAQEKTALLFKGGHWHKPKGTTPTTHKDRAFYEDMKVSKVADTQRIFDGLCRGVSLRPVTMHALSNNFLDLMFNICSYQSLNVVARIRMKRAAEQESKRHRVALAHPERRILRPDEAAQYLEDTKKRPPLSTIAAKFSVSFPSGAGLMIGSK